ncbi:hypothetical protein SH449x_002219 [Pirellulaceae bacterium SH449]
MNKIPLHTNTELHHGVTALSLIVLTMGILADSPAMGQSPSPEKNFQNNSHTTNDQVKPIARQTTPFQQSSNARVAQKSPRVDWTTLPSTYTHSPQGDRVDQFAVASPDPIYETPAYMRSGYRHTRSTLQAGFSSDNYHSVEQWGAPVRPYGEWRFPNRPFAVPYGMWGPQLPQVVGGGLGFLPWGMPGFQQPNPAGSVLPPGAGAGGLPQNGYFPGGGWPMHGVGPFGVGPGNALSPTQDDYYPQAPFLQAPPMYHPLNNGLE